MSTIKSFIVSFTQGSSLPLSFSLLGSFFRFFPFKFKQSFIRPISSYAFKFKRSYIRPISSYDLYKSFHGQPVNLTFAAECSNIATTSVLEDDISLYESECSDSKIINFLHLMEDRGIRANSQTYLWLLEGCLNCGSLLDVWKLHCRILKLGFDRELVMSDGLMDAYIAFGYLIGALKVFDDMPQRRPFSWNKIITECLDKKLMTEVLSLFRRMVSDNVDLNEATFSAVLKACGDSVCLSYVEQIHARIFSQGFDTNPLVCNPLIDLYSKNGRIDSARKVFDRLNLKDSASWVAIFSGLSGNGLGKEAVLLFHQMHISGYHKNKVNNYGQSVCFYQWTCGFAGADLLTGSGGLSSIKEAIG